MRACVAAAVMFPVGVWILGSIPWQASTAPAVVAMIILGSLIGAAMGLILGTYVPPNRISVTLTLVITPLTRGDAITPIDGPAALNVSVR